MISRLTEQIIKRRIKVLEECRAVDLLKDEAGKAMARFMKNEKSKPPETAPGEVVRLIARYSEPYDRSSGEDPYRLRAELQECLAFTLRQV